MRVAGGPSKDPVSEKVVSLIREGLGAAWRRFEHAFAGNGEPSKASEPGKRVWRDKQ